MDIQSCHFITGDTAFGVDRRGVIIRWNEAAEDSLGYPASKALGQKCWRLLSGKDSYGNRYCCRHCPIREMGFRHEPIHNFQSTYKTASNQAKSFNVSCLTIFDDPGNEMLLHICRPENNSQDADNNQAQTRISTISEPGTLSEREIEVLALLADKVSTQNIATSLSISIRTVRTHIQHLMYKLRVHKRKDAVEAGRRLKLI